MKYLQIFITSFTFIICNSSIANDTPERVYAGLWCENNQGKTEVVLSDRTRVDCVTSTHAIEFDFGKKWAESIGQVLGYSIETMKKPGIVLILKSDKDYKYWIKLNSVIDHYKLPITTWKIDPVKN